jgi:hypothetical protein
MLTRHFWALGITVAALVGTVVLVMLDLRRLLIPCIVFDISTLGLSLHLLYGHKDRSR